MNDSSTLFLHQSCKYLELNLPRIEKCLQLISEDEIWWSPNENTNSIANLIIHLSGNIRQYIISGLGGAEDLRQREEEFTSDRTMNRVELLELIRNTVREATLTINQLPPSELRKVLELQGYEMTVTEAIIHVTEHLSYHTGQIALLTKLICNQDLGFYAGRNLNILNR